MLHTLRFARGLGPLTLGVGLLLGGTSLSGCAEDEGREAGGIALTVENDSDEYICGVYIVPDSTVTWGDNRLGSEALQPFAARAIEVSAGVYDVRVVDCADGEAISLGLDLTTSQSLSYTGP